MPMHPGMPMFGGPVKSIHATTWAMTRSEFFYHWVQNRAAVLLQVKSALQGRLYVAEIHGLRLVP